MADLKFRHELKYVLNAAEFMILRNRIKNVMRRDTHAIGETYLISSLYFDDPENRAFHQKVDGDNDRMKYRIRCYNYDQSRISLERKDKVNGLTRKIGCLISPAEYEKLIKGETTGIMRINDRRLLTEFCDKINRERLRPVQIVEYCREPYIFSAGNVRVTLDTAIKSALASDSLFNAKKLTIPAMDKGFGILEVKYDGFLPDHIKNIVDLNSKQIQSNSKYVLCRLASNNY